MLKINDILNGKLDGKKPGEMLPTGGEEQGQERDWEYEYDEESDLMRPMDFCAFSYICRIKRGSAWELLADNIDLLLANAEEIAARPEMAECEDVLVRSPGGKQLDLGDALRYWREKRGGWTRRTKDGHNLYAIELDGSILSGGCYIYRLLDPVTKLTGYPGICQARPELHSAYSVRLRIKRAAHRPRPELPHPPAVKHGSSFAEWERETKERRNTVADVTPRYAIPPTMKLAEIVAYFKNQHAQV